MEKPVAFISGASGGIGGAIAERLAKEGCSLVLHYNKNKQQAENLQRSLMQTYGINAKLLQADFADPGATMAKVKQLSVSPDIVVHNSGTSKVGLITDLPSSAVLEELTVGLATPFLITQIFLPAMIKEKRGKIIVVSSVWGLTGASCEVLYSTIKGGLNTFVKALAKEVAPSNIQVNGVAPGAVRTGMLDHLSADEQAALEEEIPAGRLGTPADIASAVAFLAAEESGYINGHILSVNGAWYC
ncbi:3-oxoacyl-[acyl-carrier protein] reductase [Evansella caseinilytica]|uniref:3-oxoacyl-[acyl-carrier protein] reductase n=1 Tax=Evansella caseinilytica TaxID=1503961 RepID=A0A1H3M0P9_9BACI|nr:SDR family oxidoreductase [Evansella caseinilytica]SDY69625.1 3-oxoacyl-[acyl-carrier protein] reductase [Evansella caseinilytica]